MFFMQGSFYAFVLGETFRRRFTMKVAKPEHPAGVDHVGIGPQAGVGGRVQADEVLRQLRPAMFYKERLVSVQPDWLYGAIELYNGPPSMASTSL